jgi:predicted nucleotidyltransferase
VKDIEEIKRTLSAHREVFASKYKVKTIGVFGSYVRGKPKKKSDVDILVEFKRAVDFFEFLDLEEYLEQILGIKVDLVTKQALKPYIGKHILEEVVYL